MLNERLAMMKELGLTNGAVVLVEHSDGWAAAFESEKNRIIEKLSNLRPRIEHIGSTAIPGICAKPILDIAVGISSYTSVDDATAGLAELGYRSLGYRNVGLGTIFEFMNGTERTHCIHLLDMSEPRWDDCIFFRDTLREDREISLRYESLKKDLALQFSNDRSRYTDAKNEFVDMILKARKT